MVKKIVTKLLVMPNAMFLITRTQLVRDYKNEHPKATVTEVYEALAKHGVSRELVQGFFYKEVRRAEKKAEQLQKEKLILAYKKKHPNTTYAMVADALKEKGIKIHNVSIILGKDNYFKNKPFKQSKIRNKPTYAKKIIKARNFIEFMGGAKEAIGFLNTTYAKKMLKAKNFIEFMEGPEEAIGFLNIASIKDGVPKKSSRGRGRPKGSKNKPKSREK